MGLLDKVLNKVLATSTGKKAFCSNPYLGLLIDANDSDVIADEQFRIGMAYQNGAYMLPQDNGKALKYYRKAAERGHAVAQLFMVMGLMRHNDDHNPEVIEWLMKAAKQGERQAMYNLAISYHRGDIEGNPNVEISTHLFHKSAEKGYAAACARYAILFLNGEDGIQKNTAIAKFWALEAYGYGDENDKQVLKHIIKDDDIIDGQIDSTKIFNEAAEAGEAHAIYKIGNAYIQQDLNKSVEYWKKASDLGSNYAKCNLARYYRQEIKDYENSNALFREAAENGIEEAQQALAESYYYGIGIDKDIKQAWYWNEKAINLGYTPARYLLAVMCLQNSLTEILPDKVMRGMSYMEMAANDNYKPAINFYKSQQSNK